MEPATSRATSSTPTCGNDISSARLLTTSYGGTSFVHPVSHARQSMRIACSDRQLVIILRDLFVAGTETTVTTLKWALLFLVHHPEVKENLTNY